MSYQRILLALIATLTIISCAKQSRHNSPPAIKVTYDSSVPQKERELVELDLKTLHWATPSDVPGKSILGLSEISRDSLSGWLQKRFRYVIGVNYEYEKLLTAKKISDQDYHKMIFSKISETGSLMLNLGAVIYSLAEQTSPSRLSVMQIQNQSVVIDSPRVGVILIDEIYKFHDEIEGLRGNIESLVNSILRLSIFFHEARHSDGNGDNAGFPHVECDSGDFEGDFSCDDSSNGANSVGKVLLQSLISSCSDCNENEKMKIQLWISDLSLRVNSNAIEKDPRAERKSKREFEG